MRLTNERLPRLNWHNPQTWVSVPTKHKGRGIRWWVCCILTPLTANKTLGDKWHCRYCFLLKPAATKRTSLHGQRLLYHEHPMYMSDRLAARLVQPFHCYVLHGSRGWCGRLLALFLHRFKPLGYTTEDVLGFG